MVRHNTKVIVQASAKPDLTFSAVDLTKLMSEVRQLLYIRYASKKSVRKVINGREITFEVLRGAHEMYM